MVQATKTGKVFISAKGWLVIPRWLRQEFEIEQGTYAHVAATPEGILLKPITRAYIRSLRGSLKGRGVMKTMMKDRKCERNL